MRLVPSRLRLLLVALLLTGAVASVAGVTYAAFSASTANPASSFESAAIFARARATSAGDVRDNTSGTETNASSPFAYSGDNRTDATKNWPTTNAYNTANYLELDYNNPLPAGRAVSSVELKFRYAADRGPDGLLLLRRAQGERQPRSSRPTAGTGNDQGCVTGATQTLHTETLPIVTTADAANDLRIRIYFRQSQRDGRRDHGRSRRP